MIFYRIECNGLGLYDSGCGHRAQDLTTAEHSISQQSPERAFPDIFNHLNNDRKNYYFAFPTIEAIYEWFNTVESVAYLDFRECKIVKYEIDSDYHISGNQLIYYKGKETFIEQVPFSYNNLEKLTQIKIHIPYKFRNYLIENNLTEYSL